mmetsp:Transcript_17023/g.49175  ORF Transcript_17023/g.49175 Transcript_17023/m.49175 type:complete len:95 (-) Transcript_17023:214-498(-)
MMLIANNTEICSSSAIDAHAHCNTGGLDGADSQQYRSAPAQQLTPMHTGKFPFSSAHSIHLPLTMTVRNDSVPCLDCRPSLIIIEEKQSSKLLS